MKKTKSFGRVQKWGFERRGEGSYGICRIVYVIHTFLARKE
jgi:hypothetical protein